MKEKYQREGDIEKTREISRSEKLNFQYSLYENVLYVTHENWRNFDEKYFGTMWVDERDTLFLRSDAPLDLSLYQ